MEKIKKNWPTILLLLAIAGCMFVLNISTMISPDDYSYANVIAGEDLKITSIGELGRAVKYLYFNWTGRIIPHILIGVFMTTSVVLYKIINTVLFMVLLVFIGRFITKKNTFLTLSLTFGFYLYGKMFGEKFAWISGSANYLWTSSALIIYLYTIYGYFVDKVPLKRWRKICIVLAGLVIAFSHEVMAFVGASFLGMLFLINIKRIWKESKYDVIFLISAIILFGIGSLLTGLAPGNVARSTLDMGQKGTIFSCLGNYKDIKVQLLLILTSMIGVGVLKQKELLKKEILYFIIPCMIATIPFAIMGYFAPRCFVPYEALLTSCLCANVQYLEQYFSKYKKTIIGITILVIIIVFTRMGFSVYSDIRYILPYKIKVTKQLKTASKNEEKDVIVSKFLFMDKICREKMINIDNFFITTDSGSVVNTYASLYYKFDFLRAISDIDYLVEIGTDITENVDYGIINKDTLELISVVTASDKLVFTIPKEQYGTYVVDCRDKDLRSHVTYLRVRCVGDEIDNPNIEDFINQEK